MHLKLHLQRLLIKLESFYKYNCFLSLDYILFLRPFHHCFIIWIKREVAVSLR